MLISWRVYLPFLLGVSGLPVYLKWANHPRVATRVFQDNDICSLMMKRVYDIAASTSKQIKVWKGRSLVDFYGS